MKNFAVILVLASLFSCHNAKVNESTYKTSASTTELGSIGTAKKHRDFTNTFATRAFPKLQDGVRLEMQLLPFDKKINQLYLKKSGLSEIKVTYNDTMTYKPVYVSFSVLDRTGYINELNSPDNKEIITFIKDLKESAVVSSIAIVLSQNDILRIKEADSYYLVDLQQKKYGVALYKQGKKTEVIDLTSGLTLAYELSRFCWSVNERGQSYIADLVSENERCIGNTTEKVKEKEEKSLFKM